MSGMAGSDRADAARGGSYDGVAKLLHWLVAALLLVQFLTKWFTPQNSAMTEAQLDAWHVAVGPTILALMLLRLAWRLTHRPPAPPAGLPFALRLASGVTHWALYLLLIVAPLFGWLAASGYGVTPYLLGVIPLPGLLAPDKSVAEALGRVHGALALTVLALAGLHVAAAFFHAFIRQDGVFRRMLP